LRRFVKHLSTEYANLCDAVIAPSRSIQQLIQDRGVTRLVMEIPTGVDVQKISSGDGAGFRKKAGIPVDATVIGHLGRLAPEKNIVFLAESVSEAMRDNSESRFLVVGEGKSEPEFTKRFEDRLHMAGKLTGQSLIDAYHAMDLFVFASLTETQGLVLAEAMAAGKPVIALDAPGARELVEDGVNGRLLPADASADRFARAVKRAVEEKGALSRWSEGARKTAAQFSRDSVLKKLLGFYDELVEERSGSKRREMVEDASFKELQLRIKAEWDLAAEKMAALTKTLQEGLTP
jgi:glycosyltransferase involved in cell wall biosynthesis